MIEVIEHWFQDYVAGFQSPDGKLSPMQQLKLEHSRRVHDCAAEIVAELGWSPDQTLHAQTAALLHDIGRFPQYQEYGTYQDGVSLNHGIKGADILRGWRTRFREEGLSLERILPAVEFHNRPALPEGLASEEESLLRLVRDADKLDIFEVVHDGATHPESLYTELTTWVDMQAPVSEAVLECARERRPIRYADIHSLGDMLVAQLSWVYDLNYPPSFRIMRRRNTFSRLRALIPVENDDTGPILERANRYLERQST